MDKAKMQEALEAMKNAVAMMEAALALEAATEEAPDSTSRFGMIGAG